MKLDEFVSSLKIIKYKEYVPTSRTGNTGIGKTLEDLLGIRENNIAGPDFGNYQLKTSRKKVSSSNYLTLFTKQPEPKGSVDLLRKNFGYYRNSISISSKEFQKSLTEFMEVESSQTITPSGEKIYHNTVKSSKANSQGLQLQIKNKSIDIINNQLIDVKSYYSQEILKAALNKEYPSGTKIAYVLADNKVENKVERFWFNELYLLEGLEFDKFLDAVSRDIIFLDLRIGLRPNGKTHDHGTAFRIHPRNFPIMFNPKRIDI